MGPNRTVVLEGKGGGVGGHGWGVGGGGGRGWVVGGGWVGRTGRG